MFRPPRWSSAIQSSAIPDPKLQSDRENDFTNRNTTFMTWNLMHMARILTDAGGVAAGSYLEHWGVEPDPVEPDPGWTMAGVMFVGPRVSVLLLLALIASTTQLLLH